MSETSPPRPGWRTNLSAVAGLLAVAAAVSAIVHIVTLDFRRQSHLVNVSMRGEVGPAGREMIAGFVIAKHSQVVVIRALGPSLALQRGQSALPSPRLRIVRNHDGAEVARNEGWRLADGSPRLQTDLAPYAPADPRDAVCVLTLPAGTYSAVVESRDGKSGTAMLEIFVIVD
ncbi:MAG TPA: hypothetical protein VM029_17370 [Opitutaceae bacterium]|nr:hypothetical protein [Opitutaceae bacterium]